MSIPATARLDIAHAMRILRMLSRDDLRVIAQTALTEGHDSPMLRRLAVADRSDEIEALFDVAIAEAGLRPMSLRDAAMTYARWICEKILTGEISPYNGAKAIWNASLETAGDAPTELDPFIYAASESEDRPEDREFFDEAIRKHARELATSARQLCEHSDQPPRNAPP